ncbi:hypothetical protein ATCV1_z635R [Acanthocystis turfacea chlorella virus 1]|uniref:Uncharacterized protein z635R n=1 Tax=Chlorovirus heliozoae TaxID=322019 RepID=A7K9P5_9PHYC|nr:hypothetical protein ATCV1_z635R [Acanthocystis turfacea chlorella virus 1]ABT16769.1 hypothetical protein ATCV1_z635R [Acanthocystis turfacea chlorella virus 1]
MILRARLRCTHFLFCFVCRILSVHRMLLARFCFAHSPPGFLTQNLSCMCLADFLLGFLAQLASCSTTFSQIISTGCKSTEYFDHKFLVVIQFFIGTLIPMLLEVLPSILLNGVVNCYTLTAWELMFLETFFYRPSCLTNIRLFIWRNQHVYKPHCTTFHNRSVNT